MTKKQIIGLITGGILLNLALSFILVFFFSPRGKVASVKIDQVFDKFALTKEKKAQLDAIQRVRKTKIDSLQALVSLKQKTAVASENARLEEQFAAYAAQAVEEDQAMTAKLNQEIWGQLDQYIAEFCAQSPYDIVLGRKPGVDYILGTKAEIDLTEEMIRYINARYYDTP